MQNDKGFSIVEVLVAIAVIVVLTGLILPVVVRSKHEGYVANDLERMRQLGLANNLYHDESGIYLPGCPTLVSAGLVRSEMCSALSDPFPMGAGNYVNAAVSANSHILLVDYRNSFLGLREMGITPDRFDDRIVTSSRGWLTLVHDFDEGLHWKPKDNSLYYRLLFEGSVVKRHVFSEAVQRQGGIWSEWKVISLFGDKG